MTTNRNSSEWYSCALSTKYWTLPTPLFVIHCAVSMAVGLFWLSFLIFLAFLTQQGSFNLVVNIKAKDGDIVQQNFFAYPEKDFVTIDFKNNEGRFVTVYIDFRLVRKLAY